MESIYILLAFALGFICGNRVGFARGWKAVMKVLGVPDGYVISGVSFARKK